ncbi:NACHT domain-containing protein [Streptomyces sp. NPDC019531]|uniref:NACHT domain-containing protein n=1 Tax=Streptomyces sp. NPDC019531 TaxID=3365062 RepID=UPI00384C286E
MSDGPGTEEPAPVEPEPVEAPGNRSVIVHRDNYAPIITGDIIVSPPPPAPDSLAGKANLLATRVGAQLNHEEEQQRLWDPVPLPVRWRPAPPKLTGSEVSVFGAPAEAVDLTGPLDTIMAVFRDTERGRMMVLGQAGSGKTILIRRFAKVWLNARSQTDETPVPVIFSLGSWNPTDTPLRAWLVDRLKRDHPFLAGPGPAGPTWAETLFDDNRVLAVLDGFDEIAADLRADALRDIRTSVMPLLLTSRRKELEAAVAEHGLFDGIELTDLTLADCARGPLRGTGWKAVLNELGRHPEEPLAAVLTTPLMVTLAHTAHGPGSDPWKLLRNEELRTRAALEDHLLGSFVPIAYERFLGAGSAATRRRWRPEQARRWLGHIATHLRTLDDAQGTQDIEWWRLGTTMSLPSRMIVSGATCGLVSTILLGLVYGLTSEPAEAFATVLLNVLGIATAFGLMHGFGTKLKVGGGFEPSRMEIRIRGGATRARVRESFLPRTVGGLTGGLVFGVVFGLSASVYARLLAYPWTTAAWVFGNWLVAGLALGLGVGLILALMAGLEAVVRPEASVSPSDLLHTNRTTVLAQMATVGVLLGLGYGVVVALVNGVVLGILAGIAGALVVGVGVGTLTAWGRWMVLVRFWLPLTRRLPWAVNTFLDDAYQRGVLRQFGAVYQFRHALLRDHLAEVPKHHGQPTTGDH